MIIQRGMNPWAAVTVAVALVVAALTVPFSYERVTGHAVALTLSGPHVTGEQIRGIAGEMKKVLHAEGVRVEAQQRNDALQFTLATVVPARSGVNADAAAQAFAAQLEKLGYTASAQVSPVKERVSGTVYAYARDQVIEVNVDGKSATQIENEIKQGLADAGITDTQVSVTESPDQKQLQVKVEAKKTATGTTSTEPEAVPQLVLKRNGQALGGGNGFTVREEKRKSEDGVTLTLIVGQNGKTATIDIPHVDTMSDAAITQTVQEQLRNAGITAQVQTTDGRVEIQAQP